MASELSQFFSELKRRKVYQVAAAYGAVGVAIALAVPDLFGAFELPTSAARLVIILIALGFPVALVLAWAYEIRPEGRAEAEGEEAPETPPGEEPQPGLESEIWPPEKSGVTEDLPESQEEKPAIAVLPFANRSGLTEDAHFTDGIHDQIISQLFKVGSLSVRGRTSVEVYRGSPKNLTEIGGELKARYLMEGGVQRAGDRVRIIVQLLDARTDDHLWAEEYDRVLSTENLFEVQTEIALAVVSRLESVLTPAEKARIESRPTRSLEAYEAFLRGRRFLARQTAEGTVEAIREFEEAIEEDPGFALAYAALGTACQRAVSLLEHSDPDEQSTFHNRSREAAETAIKLDPDVSEAHVVLAIRALQWDWDWETAKAELDKAISLNASDGLAHSYLAVYLAYREGRLDEAVEVARRARELDPFDPYTTTYWLWILWASGDFHWALDEARKAAAVWPEKPFTHYWVGIGLIWTGEHKEAIAELEKAIRTGGRLTFFLSLLGAAHALNGDRKKAEEYLSELEERVRKGAAIGRWLATVHAALGQKELALDWLDRAVDQRDPAVFHASSDRFFSAWWDDSRFLGILARVGLGPRGSGKMDQ